MSPELTEALIKAATGCPDCQSLHRVGGAVRDGLLGREGPGGELDLVVEGRAIALGRRLVADCGGDLVEYPRFMTATWTGAPGGMCVDLVSARRERYPKPAALPEVEPADLEADLLRRDFSVNAMAERIWPGPFLELVDPVQGAADVEAGQLRILHPRSFWDDPCRILRAARFAARLDFSLETSTQDALEVAVSLESRGAQENAFGPLSGDRLLAELSLAFREPRPHAVLDLLDRWGVSGALGWNCSTAPLHGLPPTAACNPLLGLALWTHATDPETTGARLGLRGRPLIGWTRLVEVDRRLGPAVQAASDDAALEEALGASSAAERRALTALCPSLGGELRHYEEVVRPTPQLLGGSELRESGLPEGAAIGEALRCIRRAQLRHEVGTSAEALALLGLPLPS